MLSTRSIRVLLTTDAKSRRKKKVLEAGEKKTNHNPYRQQLWETKIKRDGRQNPEQRMLAPSPKLVQLLHSNIKLSILVCKAKGESVLGTFGD